MGKMKKEKLFSRKDIRQIRALGMNVADAENQLSAYRQGPRYLQLSRPCRVKDGILSITPSERKKLIELYESESDRYKLIKFVPASGAASRMFTSWFAAAENGGFGSAPLNSKFFHDLSLLPFYPLIKKNKKGNELLGRKDVQAVLEFILGAEGLNYGETPKALIPFHLYPQGSSRTALEEHLIEAARYVRSRDISHLHFTLNKEHKRDITNFLKNEIAGYERLGRIKYKITSSFQSASSNTIAVDENNLPLRNAQGELVFRPGGHGALLSNLNKLAADFIFIKNIDNVAPELLLERNLRFKKMMGGLALKTQREIYSMLRILEAGEPAAAQIAAIVRYCLRTLHVNFPRGFSRLATAKKIPIIFSLLNRPLRICAMVRNEGEPGGGPFWVVEKDRTQTLQIVEYGHVDKSKPEQLEIWSQAKYFNPVDMVCCIKNYRGGKFILDNYVNKEAYLITMKNEKGVSLKALEAPGLWNGSMAYWNTIFVELPLIVFKPVKSVYDLLRPQHSGQNKRPRMSK
jgi:hypothetical protein